MKQQMFLFLNKLQQLIILLKERIDEFSVFIVPVISLLSQSNCIYTQWLYYDLLHTSTVKKASSLLLL